MNITKHQVAMIASHVVVAGGATVAALAFSGIISPTDAQSAQSAIGRIVADVKDIMGSLAVLGGIAMTAYTTVKSGPLASFFRASVDIAADPCLVDQVKSASLNDKAPVVAITDSMPEVAGVTTTATRAGAALATAVPSETVQVRVPSKS